MTCQYARCDQDATVALCFGDGTYRVAQAREVKPQTFVRYCGVHGALVGDLFVTCDERPIIGGVLPRPSRKGLTPPVQ